MINYDIFSIFNVDVLDIMFEGIIALSFSHKKFNLFIVIIGIYLPPKNGSYSYDSEKYLNYLSCMLIGFEKKDLVCIIGDYNSRISDKTEILTYLQ